MSQRDKKIQFKVGRREIALGGHSKGVGIGLCPDKTIQTGRCHLVLGD